ncbi:MAG: hypothetical protein KC940_07585, partial [Candidatus Omnitrophica bacterium]|nr:hypothetical protein [Candidatus Omnitrophota bacterium]
SCPAHTSSQDLALPPITESIEPTMEFAGVRVANGERRFDFKKRSTFDGSETDHIISYFV